MPFLTYLAKGIRWGGGSDYSVTPFPARYGLWASVVRHTLRGAYGTQPFGTAEAIDVHAALHSYTIWAAHQLFLEDRIGSIEPGKDADIAVWDRDLYTITADEIPRMKCELTLVGGAHCLPGGGGAGHESGARPVIVLAAPPPLRVEGGQKPPE